jgi:hypothetical protein
MARCHSKIRKENGCEASGQKYELEGRYSRGLHARSAVDRQRVRDRLRWGASSVRHVRQPHLRHNRWRNSLGRPKRKELAAAGLLYHRLQHVGTADGYANGQWLGFSYALCLRSHGCPAVAVGSSVAVDRRCRSSARAPVAGLIAAINPLRFAMSPPRLTPWRGHGSACSCPRRRP